jgi:hypothetical protein
MTGLFRNLDLPRDLSDQALSLDRDGLRQVAWPRDAALHILDLLQDRAIAVRSGLVVQVEGGRASRTFERWDTAPDPAEAFPAFAARSQAEARKRVLHHPMDDPARRFVLALADRLEG